MDMLVINNDKDAWLRHAGALAMARIGDAQSLVKQSNHPSRALRIAAVVALRRMQDPGISVFLEDSDEYIVAEATRAIHDDFSIEEAMPALASLLNKTSTTNEVILRRSISANLRIGENQHFKNLVDFAINQSPPSEMRAEALEALGTWEDPSPLDRVDGRFRGYFRRTAPKEHLEKELAGLLAHVDDKIVVAAIHAVQMLDIEAEESLAELARSGSYASVRVAALNALYKMKYDDLGTILGTGLKDESSTVRSSALAILPASNIDDQIAVELIAEVLKIGTIREKQAAISSLGDIQNDASQQALAGLLQSLTQGELDPELHLDVVEAVGMHESQNLKRQLDVYYKQFNDDDLAAEYMPLLSGGDLNSGRNLFFRHEGAQCVRCHTIWEWGGDAGPVLSGIASRMDRKTLLESLIDPNARIAAGYESIAVFTSDESTYSGIVQEETPEQLTLLLGDLSLKTIMKESIVDRLEAASSMPGVTDILTKREIRDLVEFLASLNHIESD